MTSLFVNGVLIIRLLREGRQRKVAVQLREHWKDLEYRLHHNLSKFDWSVFLILKPISYLLFICLDFLFRNYWSSLDYDLMASI